MADVIHKNLTGSELHEPKGAAAVGSSGLTYVSDGAGSGSWINYLGSDIDSGAASAGQVLQADGAGNSSWADPGGAIYGEMAVTDNSSLLALTAVTDTTFNTDTQYVQIDSGLWATGELNDVTFNAAGYLEINTAGLYELSTWMSVSISSAGTNIIAIKYSTDNTTSTLSPRKLKRQSNNANDIGSISASGFVNLSVGDKISLFVASDATTNFRIHDVGVTVTLLKAA